MTGTSDTDGFEDCESPAGAVHRLSGEGVSKMSPRSVFLGGLVNRFGDDIVPVDQRRRPSMPSSCNDRSLIFRIRGRLWKPPPAKFAGTVVDVPVIMQIDQVTKRVEILQTKYIDRVAAMLVVTQEQAAQAQTSAKIVEVPPAKFAETAVDVPSKITPLLVRQVTQLQDCAEDGESPAGAAHERTHVQIADVPVPHAALNERISERMHEQIVDVPVPQKIKENVKPGSRDSAACGGATTGSSASNCGKDGFPVDQTGGQACLFSTDSVHRQDCRYACGDAANGPSYSHFVED